MIPSDLISRLHKTHNIAMGMQHRLARALRGTTLQYERALKQRDNAEKRFDMAVVAIIQAGAKNARKK